MNDVFAWVAVSLLCGATMLAMGAHPVERSHSHL